MKKILIFYGSYGGGHYSAAKSLQDYIVTHYSDCNVQIFDCVEYVNKTVNKVSTGIYYKVSKNAPRLWGQLYYKSEVGFLGYITNTSNKIMAQKLLKLINSFQPDLIISVLPFSSNMCSYLKKKGKIHCKLATVITDFALHGQWLTYIENTDYFFVAHEQMAVSLKKIISNKTKIYVTGIPISPRYTKEYSKEEICSSLSLSTDLPIVLLFGSGSNKSSSLSKDVPSNILRVLISKFSDLQVIAIAGKNKRLKAHFDAIVNEYNKENLVKVMGFTNQVPELLSVANFAITKSGGLTTSECLASGVPLFIFLPLPGQEQRNARFVMRNKAGYWLRKNDDIFDSLNVFIKNLDKMKRNAARIGRKNSTEQICKILIGELDRSMHKN